MGSDICEKQKSATWSDGWLKELSRELMAESPDMKGFSYRNLRYIHQWYKFYNQALIIWQQPVAKLGNDKGQQPVAPISEDAFFSVPWGQPIGISEYQLSKLMSEDIQSQLPTIEDIEATLSDIKETYDATR